MLYLPNLDEMTLDETLSNWKSQFPNMGLFALLPESQKESVATLQAVCTQHNIPLVGGIFPALLKDGVFLTEGVWLLCFPTMPYFALHADIPTSPHELELLTGQIAKGLRAQIDQTPDVTLFMLFDAMVPKIATILDQLYLQLANRIYYAGANAGSETFQPMPCLFDGKHIVDSGVLLILIKPHFGAILEHGYRAPDNSVYATSTSGNRISQIDWCPAFEVYQALVQAQYHVKITAENFYQRAVHFPFGIVRANHHVVVRIPVALHEDGSLFCVGEVPANSMLTLLEAPTVNTTQTLDVLIEGMARLKEQNYFYSIALDGACTSELKKPRINCVNSPPVARQHRYLEQYH